MISDTPSLKEYGRYKRLMEKELFVDSPDERLDKRLENNYNRWTRGEIHRLKDLRKRWSIAEIALILRRSEQSVRCAVQRLSIKRQHKVDF